MIEPVSFYDTTKMAPPFSITDMNEDLPSTFGDEDALLSLDPSSDMFSTSRTETVNTTIPSSPSSDMQSLANSMRTSELRKPKTTVAIALHYQQDNSAGSIKGNLDFASMGLIGRETEVSTLRYCLANLMATDSSSDSDGSNETGPFKELVFIKGQSGVGKSSVARTVEQDLKQEERSNSNYNGLFIDAKFDMNTMDEPYSGISKIFDKICRKIKEVKQESIPEIQQALKDGLGKELRLLMHLLPELKSLMADDDSQSTKSSFDIDAFESGTDQLRYAFRVLARVFGAVFSPLVIFFDDLQWADMSSLQVLDYLISDTQNPNAMMIIGSYRSEEVNENSLLFNKIVAFREKATKFHFHVTEMEIKAFDAATVEKIIATTLTPETMEQGVRLALICIKRTLGNPFFVFEFLKMLHHEGLLAYNLSSQRWTWDMEKIEDATMSTANVVALLHNRMKKLPNQVQILLQVAAYFGSSFYEPTLDMVWDHHGRRLVGAKIDKVSKLLPGVVQDDFLEPFGENHYRWVHDKVQEAALCLTGKHRESFQLDIGTTLYYCLDKEHLEDDLFNVVDLINRGNVNKRSEFALANMRAAKKARSISAFESGAKYAAHGIEILDESTKWTENRQLALQLYTIGAEMNLVAGNIVAAEEYCEVVLGRSELSTMETLPLKMVRAKALSTMELKFDEALEYCLKLLREIGCKLTWPRSLVPVQALTMVLRTIKKLEKVPEGSFETMTVIKDKRQKAVASLLSMILYISYHSGNIHLSFVCICKLVEMTLQHGINEFSAKSIASIGIILIVLNKDPAKAEEYGNIALSMLAKFGRMRSGETTYLTYAHVMAWFRPLETCSAPMIDGYKKALRAGETEFALWNLLSYVAMVPYILGKPLEQILQECPKAMIQFEEAASAVHVLDMRVLMQMLSNLSDPSCPDPSKLEGEIFSKVHDDEKEAKVHLAISHFAEGELLLFQGDYVAAADRAINLGEVHTELVPGIYTIMIETFHRAVVLYAAALKTKKKKYRVHAKKVRKKVSGWAKAGNPNVEYFDLFLTAEQLALDKKLDEAQPKYKSAIRLATRSGHLHHAGLLNERYADFLLALRSNVEESKRALKISIKWYKDWGATRKVKALESKLSELEK
ncbi:unnamed protein product [Cylindrotheca closterium]|uniref:Orc1-like AAA ATPase domain-containing protein n=1 Tax=Cylindrotheca closterium TaxID=2856 RepID=A0AAD2FUQ9_9STRA|nr:unnamed protein product [Cylindrotheca closterium]